MRKRIIISSVLLFAAALLVIFVSRKSQAKGIVYMPDAGVVPDSVTAVKVAESILIPIYGESTIKSELPLNAHLIENGTVWYVTGKDLPKDYFGGVVEIEIQKSDCKVLNIIHGK
ncbi:MAG TPA: NTF2 fold immunity protein [Bacteroidia bacterium]|jgi:hypothetical protein|nr:NTF2 fold immunity protein [Bacteroidia bacterium]